MPGDSLKDIIEAADVFQKKFIDPALERMDEKLDTHLGKQDVQIKDVLSRVEQSAADIVILKRNQKTVMKGAAVYATALAAGLAAGWRWVESHFSIH